MEDNTSIIEQQFDKKKDVHKATITTKEYINNPFRLFMVVINKLFSINQNATFWIIGLGLAPNIINFVASPAKTSNGPKHVSVGMGLGVAIFALVLVAVACIVQALATYVGLKNAKNETVSIGQAFSVVKSKFWRILGLDLVMGLIVMFGLLLFVIPGLIFAVSYSLSLIALLEEDLSISEALKRSKTLTKNRLLETFAFGFLGGIIPFLGSILQPAILGEQFMQLRTYKDNNQELPETHKYSKWLALAIPILLAATMAIFVAIVTLALLASNR